jgi:hypothetical protein
MTQIGLLVGLNPAQASRSLSCAVASETWTRSTTMAAMVINDLFNITLTSNSIRRKNYHFALCKVKATPVLLRGGPSAKVDIEPTTVPGPIRTKSQKIKKNGFRAALAMQLSKHDPSR